MTIDQVPKNENQGHTILLHNHVRQYCVSRAHLVYFNQKLRSRKCHCGFCFHF